MSKNRVLVLFAHPSQHRSEANKPLFEQAKRIDGVTCVDLYAEYPTFKINIDREQKRLLDHDIIIFQFPLYWYSTPAILKSGKIWFLNMVSLTAPMAMNYRVKTCYAALLRVVKRRLSK